MQHKDHFRNVLLFLILIFAVSCNDYDYPLVGSHDTSQNFKKDSEIFRLLSQVTTDTGNLTQDIVCIDFVYPVNLLIYDENLQPVGEEVISGDSEFSTFLGGLQETQSLSISYPITTTLSDGSIFSVQTNAELKLAIESCSTEDIITYYNSLFGGNSGSPTKCIWNVAYEENGNNTYAGGVFETNTDGSLQFIFNNTTYEGTWNFLYINNEFHMNINLEGISDVATDWNIDREVRYSGDKIEILDSDGNYVLKQSCENTAVYEIGQTGPSNGIIFYDKGVYSNGWRYIEASVADLEAYDWGCMGSLIQTSESNEIGKGLANSIAIANFHDHLENFYLNPVVCNPLNNGTVAAKKALLLPGGWFLPSKDELLLMYENLYLNALGDFSASVYWSSTEADGQRAKAVNFGSGSIEIITKISQPDVKTRAVRYF